MTNKLTPAAHKKMIADYTLERPHYVTYAKALERVLRNACSLSIPEAIVQSRPKGVSSFAEKCVRKFDKYGLHPVDGGMNGMTDLCGARVIVHTLEQVKAVRMFIEHNFEIMERDDKGLLLGETTFGYRDMHYLVKLLPDRATAIGFKPEEIKDIEDRIAEVQVRSVVQHAWADILHDRMYKNPLKLSAEAKRTGALLAAIMEDGDRSFNNLALEIDGMTSNYSAYASREHVENEIQVQEQILVNEPDEKKKPAVALQLARLLGPCGQYPRVVSILEPHADEKGPIKDELFLELGHALCRVARQQPESPAYLQGQAYLEAAAEHFAHCDLSSIPNIRKQTSLLARAYSRLAWSWEAVQDASGKARVYYRQALETESNNPYHLANQLGYEIFCERTDAMIHSMKTTLQQAIEICREHAIAGTELPYALFTAGRLSLLLGEAEESLGWYACGLRHFFDGASCVCASVLDDELAWIEHIHFGTTETVPEHQWVQRLITLANAFCCKAAQVKEAQQDQSRILIVAGGAASMDKDTLITVRPLLREALKHFQGTVISGGTKSGIPGMVGSVAATLAAKKEKQFELIGYIPRYLPEDAPKDTRYDDFVVVSEDKDFSPGQILKTWENLLKQGTTPQQVTLLGFGGGPLAGVEYHIALALGASVGIVQNTGGSADDLLDDPVWTNVPTLFTLPLDRASAQALTTVPVSRFQNAKLEEMAKAFHAQYVAGNQHRLPANMRPWDKLLDTYKTANLEQARYALEILLAAGFKIKPAKGKPKIFKRFKTTDINKMAELEHGRWNIERLRNGWRPGTPRDDEKKIHNCLTPWKDLPEEIKKYDRDAVKAFPEILAKAGLEVSR